MLRAPLSRPTRFIRGSHVTDSRPTLSGASTHDVMPRFDASFLNVVQLEHFDKSLPSQLSIYSFDLHYHPSHCC